MSLATLTARVIIAAEAAPGQAKALSAQAKRSALSFADEVKAEKARLLAAKHPAPEPVPLRIAHSR